MMSQVCLQFVIVVFHDHTHLLVHIEGNLLYLNIQWPRKKGGRGGQENKGS